LDIGRNRELLSGDELGREEATFSPALDSSAPLTPPLLTMSISAQENASAVVSKTRELCETILSDPGYVGMRRKIETFLANEQAKELYRNLAEKGEHLQHKQQQGVQLSPGEIADYEKDRDALVGNPIAAGFIEAQQSMHQVQESVNQYISKTLELGRVPTEEELDGGGCGHGCGCSH
jgi:cell fate (sporulation/competence/biofilm development) regulator YlbF (YheA/YmcA/DUF963 family)